MFRKAGVWFEELWNDTEPWIDGYDGEQQEGCEILWETQALHS